MCFSMCFLCFSDLWFVLDINCSSMHRRARFAFDFVGSRVQGFCDPLSNADRSFLLFKGVDSDTMRANDVARY